MADSVPKDSSDVDGTLKAVLDLIQFRNGNQRVLTDYSIEATKVVLTFKP
jgi:hypothetical protein